MRKIGLVLFIGISVLGLVLLAGTAQAAETRPVDVRIFNYNTSEMESEFLAFPPGVQDGGDIAIGDVDADMYDEIVIGAGFGARPVLQTFTKNGVKERDFQFYPFHPDFRGGLSVATGDVNGDDTEDIVVGQRSGGQAYVRIYKANKEHEIINEFIAYPEGFQGGVNVAAGDFDGDGKAEIATGPGTAGATEIRLYEADGESNEPYKKFFAFDAKEKGGATVASMDIDGDGIDELIVGHGPFGDPWVKVYRVDQPTESLVGSWRAYDEAFRGGVKVASADLDSDGRDEVVTAAGFGGSTNLRGWTPTGTLYKLNNVVYEQDFTGSCNVAAGDVDKDGKMEIGVVPDKKWGPGRLDFFRYVDVSIAEQRLRAVENANEVRSYAVSTGTSKFPTPTGTFSVKSHIAKTRMSWEYGPDHPDNYDLADVPHVLPFHGAYTIHGAYWHNNFGHQMSHGCVNESLPDAAWLYNWARDGDPVIVH